jgi:hypothetical protein
MKRHIAVLAALGMLSSSVYALTPDQAISQIASDSALVSAWTSDQLKSAIPFNSTAGNVVPSQIKLFGFDLGVEAVGTSTRLDVNAFRSIPTAIVNTQTIDMFNRLPVPMILGQAKIGLPFGLDLGARFGGLPSTDINTGDTHINAGNTVWGVDLRKKIIEEGIAKPFGLTLGLNFTRAKGSLTTTTPITSTEQSGVTLSNSTANGRSDWDTKSVGVQAILDKQIAFITPYIGASANKNFGNVTTNITSNGTVLVPGSPAQSFSVTGGASSTPNSWDYRALAGLEFSMWVVKLDLQGEYAGTRNLGGDLGLRVQFR